MVDTAAAAEQALSALHAALRPRGLLVLGLNEERATTPPLAQAGALARFRPVAPPPFLAHRHVVPSPLEGTHTFLFFERM